jgi:phosphoglycolate phosphatase-like HAD superfamily hydrolase
VRLILFDIDGTLLSAAGAGRRAIHTALRESFGSTGPDTYRFDGKTDRQIVRELMRSDGHSDETIDARMGAVLDRYLERLHVELEDPAHPATLCPGVAELLDALEAREDVVVGLLTGNIEAGARAKLTATGLDPARFVIGAFGSDHEARPKLPAVAQRRARALLGLEFAGRAIVVIGDTPDDIACGRSVGARAIGVATGHYSAAELRSHSPSAVFDDLAPTDLVMSAILGNGTDRPHARD